MRKIVYEFHQEWVADKGQLYAERFAFEASSDARKAHSGAKSFLWAKDKARPSVTDLYAMTVDVDEGGRGRIVSTDIIADGLVHEPPAQQEMTREEVKQAVRDLPF